ncbi:MAG: hypothetical protein RLO51_02790 [Thalassobaculum sp.]|uniref:hypothetical protein n=1 Tax=Thalassobaculum sp. TaxID=2022740 RepID=UPI0032ECF71C
MSAEAMESEFYSDDEKDALHILPLAIIPLKTPGLRRPRLIKNARFETVVELFRDARSGSGQIDIAGLSDFFDASDATFIEDRVIIEALAEAPSFDVYSLRLTLRSHNLKVDEAEHLRLSGKMQEKLTGYMRVFTRPLVAKVFGDDTRDISSAAQIIDMFREVDREEALRRIKAISDALGLDIEQIPGFLEDYGDIFLSLSYFKRYLDQLRPDFEVFKAWMQEGIVQSHLRHNRDAMRACEVVTSNVDEAIRFVLSRFQAFDETSKEFWKDLSRERYGVLRQLIQSHHHTVGGILCGLSVKLERWHTDFPTATGSPNKRVDFLLAEMVPGLEKIRALEKSAPRLG